MLLGAPGVVRGRGRLYLYTDASDTASFDLIKDRGDDTDSGEISLPGVSNSAYDGMPMLVCSKLSNYSTSKK